MKKALIISIVFCTSLCFFQSCKTEHSSELSGYKFEDQYAEIFVGDTEDFKGNLTIDMYIKMHSYPPYWAGLVAKFDTNEECEFSLRIRTSEHGQWWYGSKFLRFNPEELLPLDQWIRVTSVRNIDEGFMGIYIDGDLKSSRQFEDLPKANISDDKIVILSQSRRTIDATVAELRIWNKAFTEKDIVNTTKTIKRPGKQKQLAGYWVFDKVEDDLVPDLSANERTARIINR